jgi:hypothetical protein
MLGTILVVFLILALVGALPRWSHSREWGYVPTGGVGLVLFVVVILVLLLAEVARRYLQLVAAYSRLFPCRPCLSARR